MTTIKEYLKNVIKSPLTDSSYQYFSVLIEHSEVYGKRIGYKRKLYSGDSDYEILESDEVLGIIPSFGG